MPLLNITVIIKRAALRLSARSPKMPYAFVSVRFVVCMNLNFLKLSATTGCYFYFLRGSWSEDNDTYACTLFHPQTRQMTLPGIVKSSDSSCHDFACVYGLSTSMAYAVLGTSSLIHPAGWLTCYLNYEAPQKMQFHSFYLSFYRNE